MLKSILRQTGPENGICMKNVQRESESGKYAWTRERLQSRERFEDSEHNPGPVGFSLHPKKGRTGNKS